MRLIDADELRIEVQRAGMRISGNSAFNKLLLKVFDEAVSECEEVDAVPVVRCKDCEYWVDYDTCRTGSEKCNNKYCASLNISTNERFYCVYGERKTDGNDDN